MASGPPTPWTVDDFLEWEAAQEGRHELVDGVVIAMGGGTLAHAAIRDHVTVALHRALAGSGCRAFSETVKVVTAHGSFYPDVVVTCAEVSMTDDRIAAPTAIIEVLSRSTADRDRGAKWVSYQEPPSLQHYVLISPHERRVDCFSRTEDGWLLRVARPPVDPVPLSALSAELRLDAVYAETGV